MEWNLPKRTQELLSHEYVPTIEQRFRFFTKRLPQLDIKLKVNVQHKENMQKNELKTMELVKTHV